MRVLALDSTTRDGSVALVDANAIDRDPIVDERRGDPSRTHAERLPAELSAVLDAHRLSPSAIDLFAVASGPGSFTGLRIGIATMQGFALATGRPLIGISALDALAETVLADAEESALVAACMDAYRREVFTALYRRQRSSPLSPTSGVEVEGPHVGSVENVVARWSGCDLRPSVCVGNGAVLYAEALTARLPSMRIVPAPLLAAVIARMAARRAREGERPHPAALQPLYVRRPDAELARDNAERAAHHP